jgi:hypothetical protein
MLDGENLGNREAGDEKSASHARHRVSTDPDQPLALPTTIAVVGNH